MKKKSKSIWYGEWEIFHLDKHGKLLWSETCLNKLADEGEKSMLEVYLQGVSGPSPFYLGLGNCFPEGNWTLASLTEPSGNGYARAVIEKSAVGWPVLALNLGDYQAISKLVSFTASGGPIGPVNMMFLTNEASGTTGLFLAWAPLSETRTISEDETMGAKLKIKLKEPV